MEFTTEQITEYLEHDGYVCPYCGQDSVVRLGESADIYSHTGCSMVVNCTNCHKEWHEVYTLSSIEKIS